MDAEIYRLLNENEDLEHEVARLRELLRRALVHLDEGSFPEWGDAKKVETEIREYLSNTRDDRQLPGHTAQSRNQTPTG